MDIRTSLIAGINIPLPECQLVLHQPNIIEIGYIGELAFYSGLYTLTLNKTMFVEDESLLETTSNFQIFMTVMTEKEAAEKKAAVLQVLQLVCPDYKISMTPRAIVFIKDDNQPIMVDEKNFDSLQEMLKYIFCLKSNLTDTSAFNPADKKAKEIADKLMKGRQRIAKEKGDSHTSVFSQYVSILTVGLSSMSMQDLLHLTVYQLYDLIERYSLYMNWDIDVRSRLAGGKPDSKPDNWMKNIH